MNKDAAVESGWISDRPVAVLRRREVGTSAMGRPVPGLWNNTGPIATRLVNHYANFLFDFLSHLIEKLGEVYALRLLSNQQQRFLLISPAGAGNLLLNTTTRPGGVGGRLGSKCRPLSVNGTILVGAVDNFAEQSDEFTHILAQIRDTSENVPH